MWRRDQKPHFYFKFWEEGDGDLSHLHLKVEDVCKDKMECTRCRQYIPMGSTMYWQFPPQNEWGEIRGWCHGARILLRCGTCQYELDLAEKLKPKPPEDLMPWDLPIAQLAREGEDEASVIRRVAALRRDLEEIDEDTDGNKAAAKNNQWPVPIAAGVPEPALKPEPKEIHPYDRDVPEGSKRCRSCDIVKVLDEFTKDSAQPDGHYTSCRRCKADRRKELRREQQQEEKEANEKKREAATKARDRRAAEKAARALSE